MNYIILHTSGGRSYARKVARSINWIKNNKSWGRKIQTVECYSVNEINQIEQSYRPERTVIYSRAAHPDSNWMRELERLESLGFTVVNSTETLKLTSDKLACSLFLQNKVAHPKTWEYIKGMRRNEYFGIFDVISNVLNSTGDIDIIAKPYTSIEQGGNVQKLNLCSEDGTNYDWLSQQIESVPGNKVVIQEKIPYVALHRVIVINGRALPYTFIDRPEWHENDWKVSCCLNRTTMRIDTNPLVSVTDLAEKTQELIGGKINFIDIFEYETHSPDIGWGEIDCAYTISEINTACNLSIHEGLARNAGRTDWNIHYQIAKYLVKNY